MKKRLCLLLFTACTIIVHAQTAKEWLALTPVKVESPALGGVKDVNNKVFTETMLLDYSTINISGMTPVENKTERNSHLKWQKAIMTEDTVSSPVNWDYTLNYYAVYISNKQWLKGQLHINLFTPAEIYIDGDKKLTYTGNKPTRRSVSCELVPGKHTLIVKAVTQGGKTLSATFEKDSAIAGESVAFSLSPERGKNIYDILNGKRINGINVSPNGKYAIINCSESIDGNNNYITRICRISDKEIVYSFSEGIYPQWVPGQECLSFLRKEGKGNSLYTYDIEKQQETCLIKEDDQIQNYTWSPDRSYLLYYKSEDYNDKDWKLKKLSGIEDRQSYYRHRSWICKYDFSTGLHSRLTWGNLSTSLMDISHDGKNILFSTSHPDYTEYPYRKQSVYLLNTKTQKLDTLWKDLLYGLQCSFSPDDKQLLISGGPSAFGKAGENIGSNPIANQYDTQLYIYNIAEKQVKAITKDFNPSVSNTIWHTDNHIYIVANDADYVHLFRYNTSTEKIEKIECPGDIIQDFSISEKAHRAMYTASDISYPTRAYTLNLTDLQTSEWANPSQEQYENIIFGEIKDWDYNYKKGTVIDGRYYLPINFDPNKKYPLIVYYYGGTTPVDRSFGGRYPFNLYAANGYIVYVMQPSGAIGYGQEFSARHQNNWGKITAAEIISSTKAFIKAHPFVDAGKVGCMGASYGGFTTMYLTTQTDIFTCAIAHAGISSIAGYWGDGYWGYSYSTNATAHAFPWNRKDIYVDQSPLFNADKVHTPLLLIHGTKDVNVPTAQSIQFYTALKLLGKDAELVFVKDSDHTVTDYQLRILWNNTILAYFAKYLKEEPAWWQNIYKDQNL